MKIHLEYQDQFGKWLHYSTMNHQPSAYKSAPTRLTIDQSPGRICARALLAVASSSMNRTLYKYACTDYNKLVNTCLSIWAIYLKNFSAYPRSNKALDSQSPLSMPALLGELSRSRFHLDHALWSGWSQTFKTGFPSRSQQQNRKSTNLSDSNNDN